MILEDKNKIKKVKKKILIVGVGGIGKLLVDELAKKEYEVVGMDKNPLELKGTEFIQCDITKDKIDVKADVIIHLAALTDMKLCEENPQLAYDVNVRGTKRVLESVKNKKIEKFIYVSTGTYDQDTRCKEEGKSLPFNIYTKTKYAGELLVQEYREYFPVVILKPFFPYGPGTSKNRFIYGIMKNIIEDKEISLNKNGKPITNPVYISDLIKAFKLIIDKELEGIFNIAGDDEKSIKEIAETIGKILNKEVKFKETNKEVKNKIADITKIKKIGFKPEVNLKEGLEKLKNEFKK